MEESIDFVVNFDHSNETIASDNSERDQEGEVGERSGECQDVAECCPTM